MAEAKIFVQIHFFKGSQHEPGFKLATVDTAACEINVVLNRFGQLGVNRSGIGLFVKHGVGGDIVRTPMINIGANGFGKVEGYQKIEPEAVVDRQFFEELRSV